MKRVLISMLFAASVAFANTTTITIIAAGNSSNLSAALANAQADESAWVLSNFGSDYNPDVLETFSEFPASATTAYSSLDTAVGTFSIPAGSQPGTPGETNGTGTDQFTILDHADSPYCCRYATDPGGNWLDSNDITGLQLTTTLSSIFFLVTDVNNVTPSDALTITADGVSDSGFAEPGQPGNLYFVAITSTGPIGTIQFWNNTGNDGYGLNDFGTAEQQATITSATPEPAAWPVAVVALFAIVIFRKYKSRTTASNDVSA